MATAARHPDRPMRWAVTGIRRLGTIERLAVALLGVILLLALVGPVFWQQGPLDQHLDHRLQAPSLSHPLGTDRFGRDILARLLTGARWSLTGAAIVCLGTSALGFLVGVLAAMSSRVIDSITGRAIESLLALPGIVTALALTSILGPSFTNLLFALIVTNWPSSARIYRALVLRERTAPYVEGAHALGATQHRIITRHVLPNVVGPATVLATANFGQVILSLAALSFLGLGVQPPTPEWGAMINEARPYFQRYPLQMIAPGVCIVLTVLAVNLTGDAVRDAFDPRTTRRRR